jgi:peptidoglycan-associated lipoprotein
MRDAGGELTAYNHEGSNGTVDKGGALMDSRRLQVAVILLVVVLSAACAKRPAMTQAAAPPPTAAVVTAPPPPAPAPAPLAPPAPAPPVVAPPVAAAPPAPAPAPAPRPAPAEYRDVAELRDILFDFDKHAIRPDAARTLDASITWLKANPSAQLLIEGHCDERGTNAYNLVLGERRAKAAQEYLVARGVAADRITIISYGEERPACAASTEACWAQNRRDHFLAKQP